MIRYIIHRLFVSLPTLLMMSMIIFAVLALAPGDPMGEFAMDPSMTPAVREQIRASLGLDQPLHIRYIKWVTAFVRGDMGYSFTTHAPVRLLILQRLTTTLWIVGTGYVLSVVIALPLGVLAALKPRSLFDHLATTLAMVGFAMPTFITAMILILVFSVYLDWLPFIYQSTLKITGWESLVAQIKQSVMPVAVLTLFQTATLMRFVRSAMREQIYQDYVVTARSRGLGELLIVHRHMLRNALIPVVTLVALGIPSVFTGALVTEQIFRVPGIGSLLISSIQSSDTPVVMAITFTYAMLIVVCNMIADILYGFLDPRVQW